MSDQANNLSSLKYMQNKRLSKIKPKDIIKPTKYFIIAPPPFTDGKWHLATTLERASYKSIVANKKYTVVLTAGSRHAVLFAAATHGVREIDVFGMFGTEEVSKARACCNNSAKELLAITEAEPEDVQTFLQSLADSAQRVGKKLNMGNPSKKPVAKLMAGKKLLTLMGCS